MAVEAFLLKVARCDDPSRKFDVVFIHGLNGDATETWIPPRPSASSVMAAWVKTLWPWNYDIPIPTPRNEMFWPKWIGEVFPESGVWSLGYPSAAVAWRGNALPLPDMATNVLQLLFLHGLGARPIIFVTHSLGGLLVKQILQLSYTRRNLDWKPIGDSTIGILFLSTPHSGSFLASMVNIFALVTRSNWTIRDLLLHEPHLRDLNNWFRANFSSLRLRARVLAETLPTRGAMVVDPNSVDPGIPDVSVIPVEKNHFTICKPVSTSDRIFMEACSFLTDCVKKARPTSIQHRIEQLLSESIHKDSRRVYVLLPKSDRDCTQAVRSVVDHTPGMLSLTCDELVSSDIRRKNVKSADILIVGLFGQSTLGDCWEELSTAHHHRIPILAYADREDVLDELKDYMKHIGAWRATLLRVRRIGSVEDLQLVIPADLSQWQSDLQCAPDQERDSELIRLHRDVTAAIDEGKLFEARTLNEAILETHPFSPRANYNNACVLCRLADEQQSKHLFDDYLEDARLCLANAISYGWLKVLSMASDKEINPNPVEFIINDSDLRNLFNTFPEMKSFVEHRSVFYIRPHPQSGGGGGCVCGCTSEDGVSKFSPVALTQCETYTS